MKQSDLIKLIAAGSGRSEKEVRAFLTDVKRTTTQVVASGESVTLPGFVKFTPKHMPARRGRNPQTGEAVHVRSRQVVRITPLTALKNAVEAGGR